jgi:hypothetical protein
MEMEVENKPPVEDSTVRENRPSDEEHIREEDLEEPLDKRGEKPKKKVPGHHHFVRFKDWYVGNKKLSIPLSVLALLLIILAIPMTRYSIAGLALKQNYVVQVSDSETKSPVSGATVSSGGVSSTTDGSGFAVLKHLSVGKHNVAITKKYYKDGQAKVLVPIFKQKKTGIVLLSATGRQVKVMAINLINGDKINGVTIKVGDTNGKTDNSGEATLVVPANSTSMQATLSADGYNDKTVTLTVNDQEVKNNEVKLTPAGKVYFLSKLSGTVDVVKTNLDGTDRQTVLAGTGKEDDRGTVLLASRDWKYLALLSKRDAAANPKLYLISTDNDSLKPMDNGSGNVSLVGWYDDYFVYTISNNVEAWQPKGVSIKSYNAQNNQLLTLDYTNATGTSNADAQYESLTGTNILGDFLIYSKVWYQYPGYIQVSGKQDTLNAIRPDGTSKKEIKSLDASKSYFGSVVPHSPNSIYVQIIYSDGTPPANYELTNSGVLSQKNDLSSDYVFKPYPTYLLSPSDKATFWSEERDGKNTLFIGDDKGENGKQIASLSEYKPYGWFTDDYLLVSKSSSELYILPKGGLAKGQSAIKISDYHKPSQTFNGYGGGYGGL